MLIGCASMKTATGQFDGINEILAQSDYATALMRIEAAKETGYTKKDKVLYYLDAGMLNFYAGNYEKSNPNMPRSQTDEMTPRPPLLPLEVQEYFPYITAFRSPPRVIGRHLKR